MLRVCEKNVNTAEQADKNNEKKNMIWGQSVGLVQLAFVHLGNLSLFIFCRDGSLHPVHQLSWVSSG